MRSECEVEPAPQGLTFGRIVRRLLLYVGLALASLVVITLLLALAIHLGIAGYITGGWIGFVGYTGLLFWVIVSSARPHWYRWNFWFATLGLLIAHCYVFAGILRGYPQFPMIWFWPITVVEAGILGGTVEWLFPESHKRSTS